MATLLEEIGYNNLAEKSAPYILRDFEIVGTWLQVIFDAGLHYNDEVDGKHIAIVEGDEVATLFIDGEKIATLYSCWRGRLGDVHVEWHKEPKTRFKWKETDAGEDPKDS